MNQLTHGERYDFDVPKNKQKESKHNSNPGVLSLAPHSYIHVLDTNTNVTRLVCGPQRFMREEAEKIILGPEKMINIPLMSYVIIENPCIRECTDDTTVTDNDSVGDNVVSSSSTFYDNNNNNKKNDGKQQQKSRTIMKYKRRPIMDKYGQICLKHGEKEIRFSEDFPDPFPLYPGETQISSIQKLAFVSKNEALKLTATRTFQENQVDIVKVKNNDNKNHDDDDDDQEKEEENDDENVITRNAGDEWLFKGPSTYYPRAEVDIIDKMEAHVIKFNQAMKLRAKRATNDFERIPRKAGEQWLYREAGAYLPSVDEEVIEVVNATIWTDKTALHLCATRTFIDIYGIERKAGEEWLITNVMSDSHIPDVYETVMKEVSKITLSSRQFCVVQDPYVDGIQKYGSKELRCGEMNFFLLPGETMDGGIQSTFLLGEDEALLLQAIEEHETLGKNVTKSEKIIISKENVVSDNDNKKTQVHKAGDKWMVYGPCEYIPPVQVKVLERRKAIPLDENEGIYVRENKTGQVRAIIGETYMLKPTESLWDKELSPEMENLLMQQSFGETFVTPPSLSKKNRLTETVTLSNESHEKRMTPRKTRNKSDVICFRVPHNSAIQVYDYKKKTARVVFGPELVMLMPDEQISIQRLSGDKPKRPMVITSLCLMLGPDFMTDIITVETSDHARLELTLAYNWHFAINREGYDNDRIFNVRDFVGDACKYLASRIRGAVASENFDYFHKHSAKIIRSAVFGLDDYGKVKESLVSPANMLTITNVDIQHIEPVDESTRMSLQKSVQMAIEITTKSQEAKAAHDAEREEEEAKGALIQQKLNHEAFSEEARKKLKILQNETHVIETTGLAKAEAQGRVEAQNIDAKAAVEKARLQVEAELLVSNSKLEMMMREQEAMIKHQEHLDRLEIEKAEKLAEIENQKFERMVKSIGSDTIVDIARSGPEMQAKLLGGLGLKGMLITDGKSPINLFQTANGMINTDMTESN